ncbi:MULTISPECIES: hypothetical protein [Actinokineospora]|uniref:Uncharacterized protein n=1 Tax=Actinokineospora fastidiosa TaxID=1816 RepID=A0A918GFU9_9PSEU|nr:MULTISPECIES: hypothetical protein [Actinokineospora]UVS80090.1 hypothetical protein Actkin_03840 [Actinokineospora sp. UTMC 2448]GGS32980.1 hypothetical protein GCM10010171_28850 [Actinokineospora fastidiosa]
MTYGPDQSSGYPASSYQGLATPAGGQQYGQYGAPAAPPAKSGRGPVVVLVVLLVLAVIGTGTFATLWIIEGGDHTATRESLTKSEGALADSEKRVKEVEETLSGVEEDKRVAETKVGELTKCQEAGRDLIDSLDGGDTPENREKTSDALDRMDSFC